MGEFGESSSFNKIVAEEKYPDTIFSSSDGAIAIPDNYMDKFDDFDTLSLTDEEEVVVKELISRTRKTDHEHGAVMDSVAAVMDETGYVEYFTSNEPNEVRIPGYISPMLDDESNSFTVFHSHPNNTLFSTHDFYQLMRLGVVKIGVVCKNGNVYTVQQGDDELPKVDEYEHKAKVIGKAIEVDFNNLESYLNLSIPEQTYVFIYEKAFRITREYKWLARGGKIDE